MLAGVLQRLQATEVDGRLHLGGLAGQTRRLDLSGQRGAAGRRTKCLFDTPVGQEGRVNAMGQGAKLLDGVLQALAQLVQDLERRLRVGFGQLSSQPDVHGQRHKVLLGAVVEVPLDLAPGGVGGGHDARP